MLSYKMAKSGHRKSKLIVGEVADLKREKKQKLF